MSSDLKLHRDYVEVAHYEELKEVREIAVEEFESMEPGRNTHNKLLRAIRWGTFANEIFLWSNRNTYQLSSAFNSEEKGSKREFSLISDAFIENSMIDSVIRKQFKKWQFKEDSYWRAYEVQVSLIGYLATRSLSALPAPTFPHQDMIDGAVTVLYLNGQKEGGVTRVFDLNENMLIEADLQEGDTIFMVDDQTKHVVTPISVPFGSDSDEVHRLLMIVRFMPLGR